MTDKRIYFLRPVGEVGPIKIGCSKMCERRLYSIAIWSPQRLEMIASAPGSHADERKLHAQFAAYRLHHEWFAASKELLALVQHVVANGALPVLPELIALPRPKQKRTNRRAKAGCSPHIATVNAGKRYAIPYAAGDTLQAIGAREGVSYATVRRSLEAVGVARRRPGGPKGVADRARAVEFRSLYESGETLQQIAERFGVSRERVRQILRKFDVPSLGHRQRQRPTPLHRIAPEQVEAA